VYEVYTGIKLCARAYSDWVFLNSTTGQPVTVPPEMITAFFPDGPRKNAVQREKFPTPPSPPKGVFSMRRRATWSDIGPAQHVNNAVYLSYIDDCGMQVAAAFGWPAARMSAEKFGIVVRQHRIQYRQPALLDDEIEVSTWVSNVKRATAFRHYTISRVNDGTLLARARTLYVWIDIDTGRPIRIPPQFLADFSPNIVA
jgi:acyl-CoA thioester hydrolase